MNTSTEVKNFISTKFDWAANSQKFLEFISESIIQKWGVVPIKVSIIENNVMFYAEAKIIGGGIFEILATSDKAVVIRPVKITERKAFNWKGI